MKKYWIPIIVVGIALLIALGLYVACSVYGLCGGLFNGSQPAEVSPPLADTTVVNRVLAPREKAAPTPPPAILFQYGTAWFLEEEAVRELGTRLLDSLSMDNNRNITLIGHTCDIGSPTHNRHLGERRASVIKSYFIQMGLPAKQIKVDSKGEEEHESDIDTEAHREQSRRVRVRLD